MAREDEGIPVKRIVSRCSCLVVVCLLTVAGTASAVQFTGAMTAPGEWTYTLTYDPEDNYSVCQASTTITLSGLAGVTQATAPTSTDIPNSALSADNLEWNPQVSADGTGVTWTNQGSGTGNFNQPLHVYGFKVIAANASDGPALASTSGFGLDSGTCPTTVRDISFVPTSGPVGANTWVPVASHNPGKNGSQWRSDLALLNPNGTSANVTGYFFGSGGVVSFGTTVGARAQSAFADVIGQLGASGSGAIEIISDQPLKVTARTYNQVASDAACYPGGTQGQDYPALLESGGRSASPSAYLGGLAENGSYHSNIGLVNTGGEPAAVAVSLYDAAGDHLADYSVSLSPGQWSQATQPFLHDAAQTAMDSGYAVVTVQSGAGVFPFASVIDNVTNDPTTVAAQR